MKVVLEGALQGSLGAPHEIFRAVMGLHNQNAGKLIGIFREVNPKLLEYILGEPKVSARLRGGDHFCPLPPVSEVKFCSLHRGASFCILTHWS